jgi:hypothetical protein
MTRTGLLALPVLLAALVNTSAADDPKHGCSPGKVINASGVCAQRKCLAQSPKCNRHRRGETHFTTTRLKLADLIGQANRAGPLSLARRHATVGMSTTRAGTGLRRRSRSADGCDRISASRLP